MSENSIKKEFQIGNEIVDILVADVDVDGIDEIIVLESHIPPEYVLNIFVLSKETEEWEFVKTFTVDLAITFASRGAALFGSFTEK